MAEIDRTGLILTANPPLFQLRERESSAVVGASLLYLVKAEDRSALTEQVRATFAGNSATSVEARLLADKETRIPVRWTILPIRLSSGEVGSAMCLGINLAPHLDLEAPPSSPADPTKLQALSQIRDELEQENRTLRQQLARQSGAATEDSPSGGQLNLPEPDPTSPPTLAEWERRYLHFILDRTGGRISGAKGAAALLGLHPNTLRSRMKKLGIARVA